MPPLSQCSGPRAPSRGFSPHLTGRPRDLRARGGAAVAGTAGSGGLGGGLRAGGFRAGGPQYPPGPPRLPPVPCGRPPWDAPGRGAGVRMLSRRNRGDVGGPGLCPPILSRRSAGADPAQCRQMAAAAFGSAGMRELSAFPEPPEPLNPAFLAPPEPPTSPVAMNPGFL